MRKEDLARVCIGRTATRKGGRLLVGEPKTKKIRRIIVLTDGAVDSLRQRLARQMKEI